MISVRPVTVADLDIVCRHREEMFRASARPGRSDALLATMTASFRTWLAPRLADGSYFGFLLMDEQAAIAGIGLMAIDWPPHPAHPSQDRRGYVLNVFVEPSHRRQGLGKRLMEMGEMELRRRGLAFATLHATAMGRPLYAEAGWSPTSEMSKPLA